jgi:predicted metalloendopeptidase
LYHNKIHEGIANNPSENNVSAWKEYMKWTLLNGSTGLLSSTVDAANFDFMERH